MLKGFFIFTIFMDKTLKERILTAAAGRDSDLAAAHLDRDAV